MPNIGTLRPIPPRVACAGQRGQVLVWFLAFAATLAVVFAGVYSVGQATSEKQKVVNAADAAAYSGALVEARALNLIAYTNRSVVANEVLIAQMVSLQSWTDYFERTTSSYQTIFNALSGIPYVGVVFKGLAVTMQALNKIVVVQQKVLNGVVPTVIRSWEGLFAVWYTGVIRPAFMPPVMAQAARSASAAVLQANVATQGGRRDTPAHLIQATALMARNEYEWQRATRYYTGNDRKYARDLILTSRDEFSTNRPGSEKWFMDALFGNSSVCVPLAIKIGSEKQGPTRLVNFDRWEAQDTLEFKQRIAPPPGDCSWGKGTIAEPIGWGRSVADQRGQTNGIRINTDGGAGALAWKATNKNSGWTGIKSLYDVERDNKGKPRSEDFTYAVAAAKDKGGIRNNENLGFESRAMAGPLGSPDLKAGFAKDQMISLAEARIFFARPVRNNLDITGSGLFRADSFQEYASLYNPYWQVRLSAPSQATRLLVYGAAGLNPALEVFAQ
ncbi:pilus assembly protein TadG-related protein [Diaphorobacter sp.]|uniref:pilus assembly protein TadG-related protein n=1 Tax=Diaphorobacter sp. TaxID=1934310 RepID=UPI0025894FF7|nr:pilus assembly protein TadG-related protein [Diaphorobacter sp.]